MFRTFCGLCKKEIDMKDRNILVIEVHTYTPPKFHGGGYKFEFHACGDCKKEAKAKIENLFKS